MKATHQSYLKKIQQSQLHLSAHLLLDNTHLLCDIRRLENMYDSNSLKIGTKIAVFISLIVRGLVIHMHINNDNNSNFNVKNLVIFMFLTTLASTTLANEQCAGQNGALGSCTQAKPENILESSQEKEDLSITTLYYSGSILHKTSPISETISQLKTTNVTDAETVETPNDELTRSSPLDLKEDQIYKEIGKKFQQFDQEGRKKIQKCLRYGRYRGKIDGLWGNQTFASIIDFKENSGFEQNDTEKSLFLKIKNIFSNEKVCNELINDIFNFNVF